MTTLTAMVQPISLERRIADRHACKLEAVSRPLENVDSMWWGATVRNLSSTGIALTLCFPFCAGTYLAVDLKDPQGATRTLLTRVVHTQDLADGSWHLGCELVKHLSDSDLELMI